MNARNHSWFGLITFCITATIAAALAFALVLAGATLAFARVRWKKSALQSEQGPQKVYSGVVTDSLCGAKHNEKSGMNAAECMRMCVSKGAHYALVNGDKLYVLEVSPASIDKFAGERVQITGTLRENTIQVSAVTGP